MDKRSALDEIQKMHNTKTVCRESIIGWYNIYSHKLPKMLPERSLMDTLMTMSLWMQLTDRGGSPGFPFEYKADFDLSLLDTKLESVKKGSFRLSGISILVTIGGIILIFIKPVGGIIITLFGIILDYYAFKKVGGANNLELLRPNEMEQINRSIEWINVTSH